MRKAVFKIWVLIGLCILAVPAARASQVSVLSDSDAGMAAFAVGDIKKALTAKGHQISNAKNTEVRIVLATFGDKELSSELKPVNKPLPTGLKPEGFAIRKTSREGVPTIWVIGADEAGVMYGGLELAEVISIGGLAAI